MQRRFRIGTFNVENLASSRTNVYGRYFSAHDCKEKQTWIGQILRTMGADLIGFQEVWSDDALEEALEMTSFTGHQRYSTIAYGGRDGKGPRVAVATRLPVLEPAQTIKKFPRPVTFDDEQLLMRVTDFRHPTLRIVVELAGHPVTVFVAHLKSKRPDFNKPRDTEFAPEEEFLSADLFTRTLGNLRSLVTRASEAAALRDLVIQETLDKKHPVIVLGDLNDGPHSVTTDMVEGEDPYRHYDRIKKPGSSRTYTRQEDWEIKHKLWGVKLYNAELIQSRRSLYNPIYTHIHNGRYESLDHILVSEEFYYRNGDRIGNVEYLHCFNDHLVDESIGGEPISRYLSDHAPLVATLSIYGRN